MERITDICALGEMIIDFTYYGESGKNNPVFEANPGGAPCNVVACTAKLGNKSGYIGKVGNDMLGNFFYNYLSEIGVDNSGVMFDDKRNTTLTFVSVKETGDRAFQFYRDNTADIRMKKDEINYRLIDQSRIFHFGTVSMTDAVTRETTFLAADYAKNNGKWVSFDPNYRENIWEDQNEAFQCILQSLRIANIVKVSEEELKFITKQDSSIEQAAGEIRDTFNIDILLVTLGEKGAYGFTKCFEVYCPALNVQAIDTTGAGDAFMGGFLHYILSLEKDLDQINENEFHDGIKFANIVGSLTTTKKGAIPALPCIEDIKKFF